MRNYYDVLKVDKNCTDKEIKDSFIKLSKLYHPDMSNSPDAHKKFIQVNEAYSVLGKKDNRRRYDAILDNTMHMERDVWRYSGRSYPKYYEYAYNNTYNPAYNANKSYITKAKVKTVILCVMLLFIGSGLQVRAEKRKRDLLSHRIAMSLRQTEDEFGQDDPSLYFATLKSKLEEFENKSKREK